MAINLFKTILKEFFEEEIIQGTPRELEIELNHELIITLIGSRRVGKTTLLKQLAKQLINNGMRFYNMYSR